MLVQQLAQVMDCLILLELQPLTADTKLQVGSGTSIFAVDADGVGIGSTANGFKLRVVGESRFSGSIVATAFTGDGSGLTNLSNDSLFNTVPSGIGTGISPNDV